jgi:hypothetical protein
MNKENKIIESFDEFQNEKVNEEIKALGTRSQIDEVSDLIDEALSKSEIALDDSLLRKYLSDARTRIQFILDVIEKELQTSTK